MEGELELRTVAKVNAVEEDFTRGWPEEWRRERERRGGRRR
jgi:hypothetical protein